MIQELISDHMDEIVAAITSKLGVNSDQAGGFVTKAIGMIEGLVSKGDLDVKDLASGNLSALTSKLDMGSLGSLLGGGQEQATQGLETLMGPLTSKLSAGGAMDMLGKLAGGDKGGLGGMVGKIFGG